MGNIGIIAAMQEEMQEIKNIMNGVTIKNIYELEFYEGIIGNKSVILVQSGVGKVNAARVTQILIDNFQIDFIINVGTAGAIDSNLNIGDIVIANKVVQHDFDITAFNHEKGYISGVGRYIECDEVIIKNIFKILEEDDILKGILKEGIIASGDIFCTDINMKNKIFSKFNAQCVDMEGAAVGQVAFLDKIPFIIIRSISDSPNGNNAITFEKFIKFASKRCAMIIQKLMEK